MGFTQRQAGGKFTRDEADEFIQQLEAVEHGAGVESVPKPPAERLSKLEEQLRKVKPELLAAELQRRGWVVLEPD